MGRATHPKAPTHHRDALASITAALAELEEWRSGTREHANMLALRSHCDEIDARSRDGASEHPEFARLQRERDESRDLLEAERANLASVTADRDRLRLQLQYVAIPDDAERKAQLWDWLRTLVPATDVGPCEDWSGKDRAAALVRDAAALRMLLHQIESMSAGESRYGKAAPDGKSLSVAAHISDALANDCGGYGSCRPDSTGVAESAMAVCASIVAGILDSQQSWDADTEQWSAVHAEYHENECSADAWRSLARGLGAMGNSEAAVARPLRRCGMAIPWNADAYEIGEIIVDRLERAS